MEDCFFADDPDLEYKNPHSMIVKDANMAEYEKHKMMKSSKVSKQ